MAGTQMIKVILQRDSLHTPWGFRLQGGADFATPFTINKITAGSPADGALHRGDVILEIDDRRISAMHHMDALELVQRAGGQISFLIQRGSGPLQSYMQSPRPFSAMPWSLISASSYLDKTLGPGWRQPTGAISPANSYRSRALERIPDPKPVLSQTGSPLMPGPVPSVSTKTRGFIQPPAFRTQGAHSLDTSPVNGLYSPVRLTDHNSAGTSHQTVWYEGTHPQSDVYVPSYQKKVIENPAHQKRTTRHQPQYYTTIQRQPQNYRPSSTQPAGLVHRQFNSPMGLYSSENIQDAMRNHVSHVTHVSIVPSQPKGFVGNYKVAVSPSHQTYTTMNAPVCYVQPKQQTFASDF